MNRKALMNTCYIIGSGDFTPRDFTPRDGDFIVAADGGYAHLARLGAPCSLLAGDFDSLGEPPEGVPLLRFPREKDDTDMALALKAGWEKGYRTFRLYGGSGDRPDHFMANLQLCLRAAKHGADIALVCPGFTVYTIHCGERAFQKPRGAVLSVFCAGNSAEGVTLQNVKYPLTEARLTGDFALGVSNEFIGENARVRVRQGALWVFVYEEEKV